MSGLMGRVGTFLAENNVNIAEWWLGRTATGIQIPSFINLDVPASPEVLAKLAQMEGVVNVRQVML